MKNVPPPVAIPQQPPPPPGLAWDVMASGPPVHPEDRVRLFSAEQWERFVQEWVDSLRDQYELVEQCGGAADMGRDVLATVKGGKGAWDNYQLQALTEGARTRGRVDRTGQARLLQAAERVLVPTSLRVSCPTVATTGGAS